MILGKRLINTGVEAACTTDTADVFGDSSGVALYTLDYDASEAGGLDGSSTDVEFGVGGQINYGARFNGSSSYINLGNNASNNDSTFSVSLWFKTSGHSTTATLINNGGANSGERGYFLGLLSSGYLRFSTSELVTAFTYNGNVNYADGAWHHIVLSYDSGTYSIYVDGNTTPITSGTNGTFISTATRPTWIGRFSYDPSAIEFFNGDIDQVRLFTKALNSTEVSTLYAETACVYTCTTDTVDYPTTNVAYYKLDNSAIDEIGSYDGTETDISYTFGRFGQAAVFNGSSSVITVEDSSANAFGFANHTGTVSAWVNINSFSAENNILAKRDTGSPGNRHWMLLVDTSKNVNFFIYNTDANQQTVTSSTVLNANQWYHIAVTLTTSNVIIYINGVEDTTASSTYTTIQNDGADLQIGRRGTNSSYNYFNGNIDQVRIFSSALDSTQVTQLYEEKPCADTSTFETVLWDGTGSTQYISSVGFEPDLVWIKGRDDTWYNILFDVTRGTNKIYTNVNWAEASGSSIFQSFDANGFTITGNTETNFSGQRFVAWCWKAGGDAISNTNGDITSQVSANQDAGFSIVKYTGNGTAGATIGHGLSAKPEFILIKNLDSALNWIAYDTNINSVGYLDLNDAFATSRLSWGFNNTDPTDTLITLGSNSGVNASSNDYIAYCFHSVSGVSKVGSYTGNGTSQSITTGFQPRFVIAKMTSGSDNWRMYDSIRGGNVLYPNLSNAEDSVSHITFDSNGFTWTSDNSNSSSQTFIYLAFA